MSFEITGTMKLVDEASGAFEQATGRIKGALGEVEQASNKVAFSQAEMNKGAKDVVTGLSGAATAGFGLYLAYDRLQNMQYQVQKANLAVERASYQVAQAQEAYNRALEKYGPDSTQAVQAAERLRLAQEQQTLASERAQMVQNNLGNAMMQTGLMVIPSLITMVTSLTKVKEGWAAAQAFLNKTLLANPIFLVVAVVAALVAAAWAAYQHCEWFREAVNAAGKALYDFFKPAIDAVIGAVQWLANALGVVWNALTGFADAVVGAWNWLTGAVGSAAAAIQGDSDAMAEKIEEDHRRIREALGKTEDEAVTLADVIVYNSMVMAEAMSEAGKEMIVVTEAIEDALPPVFSNVFGRIKDAVLSMTGTAEAYYTAWRDKSLRLVEESMQRQLSEVETRYAEMTRVVDEQLQQQLAEIQAHYAELKAAEDARFSQAYADMLAYWNNVYTKTETELDKLLAKVNKHYDDEVSKVQSSHDEQINSTMKFYDELLTANEEGLRQIREGRKRDLDDLELNMLLQKQALKEAHESGAITTEEYNMQIAAIEKGYNEQRRAINDDYRLQELQEEKAAREREAGILEERNAKISELEAQRNEATAAVNAERLSATGEINAQAAKLEHAHQEELSRLSAEEQAARNAATEAAEAEKARIIAEQEAEQQRIIEEAEKQKLDIINRYGEKMETASGNWWDGITSAIGNACASAGQAISDWAGGVWNAMQGAGSAVQGFINSICFSHAIHEAVESSLEDLDTWEKAVGQAMKDGAGSVQGFISEMEKPILAVAGSGEARMASASAPAAGASIIEVTISAPLVHIEGSADRRTAELAAELIEKRLRNVILEASSSAAPDSHKRIRLAEAL